MTSSTGAGRWLPTLLVSFAALGAFALSSCGRSPVTGSASPWRGFTQQTRFQTTYGTALAFTDARLGWLIRFAGSGVAETRDGARTWHPCPGRIVGVPQQGIGALPTRVARLPNTWDLVEAGGSLFVACEGRNPYDENRNDRLRAGVLVSRDGGRTFHRCLYLPTKGSTVSVLAALDARHLWALCDSSESGQHDEQSLRASADGGSTWRTVWRGHQNKYGTGLLGAPLQFVDAVHGWGSFGEQIVSTSDGGATWTPVGPDYNGFSVAIGREHLWYAWGTSGDESTDVDGGVSWSNDGGRTWHEVARFRGIDMSGPIFFADALHGWVEGPGAGGGYDNAIWATSDGGRNWHSELDFRAAPMTSFTFARAGDTLVFASGQQTFVRRLQATP